MPAPRVVSLLASGTEIVCGLGAGHLLVGRSHECDNPSWVTSLPACSQPAFDVSGTSGEIDAEVRRRLKSGEALFQIDTELIDALGASLLITQSHCDVCAVTADDVRRTPGAVERRTISLQAGSVLGIYEDIFSIGAALGLDREATHLVSGMKRRIRAVRSSVQHEPAPTVVVLEWTDPVFPAGNWMPELVENANARLAIGERDAHSKPIDWNDIRVADPDFLIVAPCGFDLPRTVREIAVLEALPGWEALRAVRQRHVALADGNKYFNRSGTTIVETVEILAEIVHGRSTAHRDVAWRNLADVRAGVSV